MRKQFKNIAMGLTMAMAVSAAAPAAQTAYAGTEVYSVTLGTSEQRAISEVALEVGEVLDLNFYGVKDWNKNQANYKCKWTANGDAVTVTNWGVVTAVKGGTAVVSLSIKDTVTGIFHDVAATTVTVPEEAGKTEEPTTGAESTETEEIITLTGAEAFYYTDKDGEIWIAGLKETVSGDFDSYEEELEAQMQQKKHVVIPDEIDGMPVTGISEYAFYRCSDILSVVLPKNLKEIGTDAFNGCSSITSIEIPEGVTEIPYWGFAGCEALETVKLPSTLTYVGPQAFYNCTSLKNLVLPEGLTEIGEYAFASCTSLESLEIPSTVTYMCMWSGGEGNIFWGWTENQVIYVTAGSYAEECLKECGIPYQVK